jgi:putative heme-binding domain-containing protein
MSKLFLCAAFCVWIALASVNAGAQEIPVELPQGFSIQKVAGDELVPDASAMTVDSSGIPIVSGPGYVRRLIDDDGDGLFDKFETLAATKGIAQGVWFDGKQMWLTVDGAIKRSVSREGDQPFVFEDVVPITTDAEHGAHAIRKGADGWWYVICGNATKIRDQYHSLSTSPVKKPRAGFLMRFPADVGTGEQFKAEIFCHGFRNAYDFDFDDDKKLFVYDSDGERDISLPWYRPTRIFRMRPGDDAGWVSASWKRPAGYIDMPELIDEFGRGSPTGVAVCRSEKFGRLYQRGIFVGDWTFGRIGFVQRGGKVEVFAKPKEKFGFAITDLEFAQDGSLFVSTGGRGTEGALYRIRKTDEIQDVDLTAGLDWKREGVSAEKVEKLVRELKADGSKRNVEIEDIVRDGKEDSFANDLEVYSGITSSIPFAIRELQLSFEGCDGNGMFAGHRAKNPREFSEADRESISKSLRTMLNRSDDVFEVARLIGMLHLKDDALTGLVANVAVKEKDPVKRIHYLNCVATEGGKLNDDMVPHVADSLLRIRREIDVAAWPVDRNWNPRMQQLARELFRDMRIPEAIVKDASFGQPSDIWMYDSLPEIFRSIARAKIAAKVKLNPDEATREQLQCLSVDPKRKDLIRTFADEDEFTDIVVMAISAKPDERDFEVLSRGLKSFNLTVNKSSLIGLKKIERYVGQADDFVSLLRLESQLGWTNPEVSVRDQVVMLLQKWTDKSFGYQIRQYELPVEGIRKQREAIAQWKKYLTKNHAVKMEIAASLGEMIDRYTKIDFSIGDPARGKIDYKKFQCATCHDGGGQNSGPALAGIASRFSRDDVLRAIVDPNDNVPDRYRAVVVATEDGQLFRGSVVYESMAGIMLATSTGEVVRIDSADIESRRKSSKSLMPEGLLNDASDQDVADLWAYLRGL